MLKFLWRHLTYYLHIQCGSTKSFGKDLNLCFCLILDDDVLAICCGQFHSHILICVCMIDYVCVSKNSMFDRLSNLAVFLQGKFELERSQAKMLSNATESVQCIMQPNPTTRVLQCCQFYEVKYTAAPRFKRAITQNASLAKVVMQMMKKSCKVTTHCLWSPSSPYSFWCGICMQIYCHTQVTFSSQWLL